MFLYGASFPLTQYYGTNAKHVKSAIGDLDESSTCIVALRTDAVSRSIRFVKHPIFGVFESGEKAAVSSIQMRGTSRRFVILGVIDPGSIPSLIKTANSRKIRSS